MTATRTLTAVRTHTVPSDEQIMEVIGLTSTSTHQLCERLRNIFAGRHWSDGEPELTLFEMQEAIYACNVANGWYEDERSFGAEISLLHSEVSEMFEAFRDDGFDDTTAPFVPDGKPIKPEGFGAECADVLIRWLDACRRQDWPLPYATLSDVEDHSDYDLVGDGADAVGDHIAKLHALITNLETQHVEVLRYLSTWCDRLGINLQREYERKMAFNLTRGYKHGGKRL